MAHITFNNIITINRGDSFSYDFKVQLGKPLYKVKYVLTPQDKVYLGVGEANQPFEDALLKQVYTDADLNSNDEITIKFKPQDTLKMLPGTYYYSIKLSQVTGGGKETVTTLVPQTKFIIIE